ncbi:MAG: virulence factor [Burkholderiales bacterium]
MFAIAFDLIVKETAEQHPRGVSAAYADIKDTLSRFGYTWVQGSLYTCPDEDLANLFGALMALKSLSWFPESVRDIRAFRVEQWSDFTGMIKEP